MDVQPDEHPKVWLLVRKDLNMRKGKMGAQTGHGSVDLIFGKIMEFVVKNTKPGQDYRGDVRLDINAVVVDWYRYGQTKIVLGVDSLTEMQLLENKLIDEGIQTHTVIDNGTTEFKGVKTGTVLMIGPAYPSEIGDILEHLKPL